MALSEDPALPGMLLDRLYAAMLGETDWRSFLEGITEALPQGRAVLMTHDVGGQRGQISLTAGLDERALRDYGTYYSKVNPWMMRIGERPIGLATHSDWSISRGQLVRSEFYNDYLQPLEIEVGYGVTIAAEGSQRFLLSVLHDSLAGKDERLLRLMEMLQPHLARAFRAARRASLTGGASLHGDMLDSLGAAIVYLSDRRKVVYANSIARQWIETGSVLRLDVHGSLTLPMPAAASWSTACCPWRCPGRSRWSA